MYDACDDPKSAEKNTTTNHVCQKTTTTTTTTTTNEKKDKKAKRSHQRKRTKRHLYENRQRFENLSEGDIIGLDIFDKKRAGISEQAKILLHTMRGLHSPQDFENILEHFDNFFPCLAISRSRRKQNQSTRKHLITDSEMRCIAYVQSGQQCSRRVKNKYDRYCGLHSVLRFGDLHTGYLKKNSC
jgi:hypothetical protein